MTDAPSASDPTADKARRIRALVRRIADRQPLFRGVLRAHRHDLGELVRLVGVDDGRVFVRLDTLASDVADLLYWASDGEYDAHARVAAAPLQQSSAPGP